MFYPELCFRKQVLLDVACSLEKESYQRPILLIIDIAHLFPYITPHVRKKWRQLADALGLEDVDLTDIVVIPHGKQSHYAGMVLDIWLNKDKTKATKQKLNQALEAINGKKALGRLSQWLYAVDNVEHTFLLLAHKCNDKYMRICRMKK